MLKHSAKAVVAILSLYILQSTLHAFTPPFQIESVQTFPGSFYEQSAHKLIDRFQDLDLHQEIIPFLRSRTKAIGAILKKTHSFLTFFQEISYTIPGFWEMQTNQNDIYWFGQALATCGNEYKEARLQFLCQYRIKGFSASLNEINILLDTLEPIKNGDFNKFVAKKFDSNWILFLQLMEFGNLAAAVLAELEAEATK
jgi:hypothetical protein